MKSKPVWIFELSKFELSEIEFTKFGLCKFYSSNSKSNLYSENAETEID